MVLVLPQHDRLYSEANHLIRTSMQSDAYHLSVKCSQLAPALMFSLPGRSVTSW